MSRTCVVDPSRAARAHPISRRNIDPDALRVLYRLQQPRYQAPIWSAAASATCCSAGGRRTSTSARTRIRTRSRGCSGTAGSSAAASVWRTSSSARRPSRSRRSGRTCRTRRPSDAGDRTSWSWSPRRRTCEPTARACAAAQAVGPRVAPAPDTTFERAEWRAPARDRAARSIVPSRQHLRHAGGGRVPPRLHDQRALLRHRHLLGHRLRRRPRAISSGASCDRSAIRACDSSRTRCACCAPRCWPRGSASTWTPLVIEAIAEHRGADSQGVARAADRGVLQDPAFGLRGGDFRALGRVRLLELIDAGAEVAAATPSGSRSRDSIATAQRFPAAPAELTQHGARSARCSCRSALLQPRAVPEPARRDAARDRVELRHAAGRAQGPRAAAPPAAASLPRLTDPSCRRASRAACPHRPAFADALTWLEIFGDAPDAVEHWKALTTRHRAAARPRARRAPTTHAHAA